MPQLVVSNFIQLPWEHFCEALQKSHQHSNKDFQSRTMRGGGRLHNQDPLVLKMFFFCSFSKFIKSGKCTRSCLNIAGDLLARNSPIPSYLQMSQKNLEIPNVAVGEKRPSSLLLSALRFYFWVLSDAQPKQLSERNQNRI